MSDTFKSIRKAVEDLTNAYKRILGIGAKVTDYQKLEEMDDKLKGKASVLKVEDFIVGEPSYSKKNITPSSISDVIGIAKTRMPFIINGDKLGVLKNGEKYILEATFIVKSVVSPPFVQILIKNITTGTLLDKSNEVPVTQKKVELNFIYQAKNDEQISFLFDIGGNVDCEVEWKAITFYKLEPQYTNEQKSVGNALLDEHVKPKFPFFNAIRNRRGSLLLPLAEADDEAVPLKQVDYKISRINDIITAEKTERVNTDTTERKERIAGDANRYTKSEVDSKLSDISSKAESGKSTAENALSIAGNAYDKDKTSASGLFKLFRYGYIQFPGTPTPDQLWSFSNWRWQEVNYNGCFFRTAGGKASSFNSGEQGDAIRNMTGSLDTIFDSSCYYQFRKGEGSQSFDYSPDGVLTAKSSGGWNTYLTKNSMATSILGGFINFNASRSVPTADEVRPINQTIRIWKLV